MGLLADFAFGVCFIEAFGEIHFFFHILLRLSERGMGMCCYREGVNDTPSPLR